MVIITFDENFKQIFKRLDTQLKERTLSAIKKVTLNVFVGKPMRYARKGTREVYLGHFRLSYVYFSQTDEVVITDLYHKDEQ